MTSRVLTVVHKRFSSRRLFASYEELKRTYQSEIEALPEVQALQKLEDFLRNPTGSLSNGSAMEKNSCCHYDDPKFKYCMSQDEMTLVIDAAFATFVLHVESRIAALCGEGYYTIGPCGEEMLGAAALALNVDKINNTKPRICEEDAVALHYRHLSINIVRQLMMGKSMEDILLDRARGYVVSSLDPVTGGVHCALGGESKRDFIVTSTLASQTPPAVGRALGFSLARNLLGTDYPQYVQRSSGDANTYFPSPVSFVTLGDGSVNNAHFLSALNLSLFARHKRFKCPVVFGISDNNLSISLKSSGYLKSFVKRLAADNLSIPVFVANGRDMFDVYDKTMKATVHSRKHSSPSIVVYSQICRRFGHAASDRQWAYLTQEEIEHFMNSDVISSCVEQVVRNNAATIKGVEERFHLIKKNCRKAFEMAILEPKHTCRVKMVERTAQPLVKLSCVTKDYVSISNGFTGQGEVMRKLMNRAFVEAMDSDKSVVYIGEDVCHGGYYLVTDQLEKRFPSRVCDFPPDETTLLGVGIGYSQLGLTPIVEIPYAKYLDCGFDMFNELAISNWLSNGKSPNGMIVRLQGFGRGRFGGNFHTHNVLHLPPGIDVVCYSNGEDYVKGFRYALAQAKRGRVVMFVDCTYLLNLRHIHRKDRSWERTFPPKNDVISFDNVFLYGSLSAKIVVVTYGDGVVSAIRGREQMVKSCDVKAEDIAVVDCPYISGLPEGLINILKNFDCAVFADICKEGQSPFASTISKLNAKTSLPNRWKLISAQPTYNPLGSLLTFLQEKDIVDACKSLLCIT